MKPTRAPDFMIIGAAKSGTTSLYAYLQRHTRIYFPDLKEPEYFSRQEIRSRGRDWYSSLFSLAPQSCLLGEASTTYSRWPHTLDSASLIRQETETSRFIYLLRDPVQRAYSHYVHHMRPGVTMTFEQALEHDPIYFDCGNYMMQIERYLRYFSRDQICTVRTDALRNNIEETLRHVTHFLGLETEDLTTDGMEKRNQNSDSHYLRNKTVDRLKRFPGMGVLTQHIPQTMRRGLYKRLEKSRLGKAISSRHVVPPLTQETADKLRNRYRDSVLRLEDYTQRGFQDWLE